MKQLFISYELALILKNKGFDEPCLACWWKDNKQLELVNPIHENGIKNSYYAGDVRISAPLYQQVIDWFRETHKLSITIKHYTSGTFSFEIQKSNGDATGWTKMTAFMEQSYYKYYDAMNGAIEKAITLI